MKSRYDGSGSLDLGQQGRVGAIFKDLAICFNKFRSGDTSAQSTYRLVPDAKPEMLRARAAVPLGLPANSAQPGEYFLRDNISISKTPPVTTTGIAWLRIKWSADCDIDLYARSNAGADWLYFGNARTRDGFFNRDFQTATGPAQWEFIEFRPIDLTKVNVAINLYAGDLPAPPEGLLRVWFNGNVSKHPSA